MSVAWKSKFSPGSQCYHKWSCCFLRGGGGVFISLPSVTSMLGCNHNTTYTIFRRQSIKNEIMAE